LSRCENFCLRWIELERCRLADHICFGVFIFVRLIDDLIDGQDPNIAQDGMADRTFAVAVQNIDAVVRQDEATGGTLGGNPNRHGALARRQYRGEVAGMTRGKILFADGLAGSHAVANDGAGQGLDRVRVRRACQVDGIDGVLRPRLPTQALFGDGLRRLQIAGGNQNVLCGRAGLDDDFSDWLGACGDNQPGRDSACAQSPDQKNNTEQHVAKSSKRCRPSTASTEARTGRPG
jgi:hypothetical protein